MRFLLFFLLISPFSAFSQNQSGVLIIYFPSLIEDRKLALFESEKDKKPVKWIAELEQIDTILSTVFTYGGRPFVAYRCDVQYKNRFFIRAYQNAAKGFWVEKDSLMEFETWNEWFTGFGRITISKENPIRKSPSDTGRQIERSCSCHLFSLDSISGDWMKISFDETCEAYFLENCPAEKANLPGWIRWRDGDKIWAEVYIAE